jgi:hypothetical protein
MDTTKEDTFEWIDQHDLEQTQSTYSNVVEPLCMQTDNDSSYGLLRIGETVAHRPLGHVVLVDLAATMKLFGRIHVARACIRRLISTLSASDTLTIASFTRTLYPRTRMNREAWNTSGLSRTIGYPIHHE